MYVGRLTGAMNTELRKTVASALDNSDLIINMDQRKAKGFDQAASPMRGRARSPTHFFFSIETLSTVGYGTMAPPTLYGHAVSASEIVCGMVFTAIMLGLLFVR